MKTLESSQTKCQAGTEDSCKGTQDAIFLFKFNDSDIMNYCKLDAIDVFDKANKQIECILRLQSK